MTGSLLQTITRVIDRGLKTNSYKLALLRSLVVDSEQVALDGPAAGYEDIWTRPVLRRLAKERDRAEDTTICCTVWPVLAGNGVGTVLNALLEPYAPGGRARLGEPK
jgi:hypothetical protein